jgi:hypothetical protein
MSLKAGKRIPVALSPIKVPKACSCLARKIERILFLLRLVPTNTMSILFLVYAPNNQRLDLRESVKRLPCRKPLRLSDKHAGGYTYVVSYCSCYHLSLCILNHLRRLQGYRVGGVGVEGDYPTLRKWNYNLQSSISLNTSTIYLWNTKPVCLLLGCSSSRSIYLI